MDKPFDDFEVIILDGYGTLYDQNYELLNGAQEILKKSFSKAILLSNVGSLTGTQLINKLQKKKISPLPSRVITSLDLLLNYLRINNLDNIFHYGGFAAQENIERSGFKISQLDDSPETIVFTSLPSKNWIEETQKVLRIINNNQPKKLILANPDRLLPGKHVGINVGMMFDMMTRDWPKETKLFEIIEIGKPKLCRSDLLLKENEPILVIGDNKKTDGILAKNLHADFMMVPNN